MDESLGLYDSDTGQSIEAIATVEFGHDETGYPISVSYAVAQRGRIAQIRSGSLRVHYFLDEPAIDQDADRIGRWLAIKGSEAVRIIRELAPKP